jgi:hypothetical protein
MTESEQQAVALLDEWMAAFNARDIERWAATFNYPSVRLASGRVIVLESPASLRRDTFERLASIGWERSAWDRHDVINSSDDKVHFDTRFSRYRADGSVIGTYDSIYVVTRLDGHWGVQARSSFAP